MNASFIRRMGAYLIDLFILGLLISMMLVIFNIGGNKNIKELETERNTISTKFINEEINYENYLYQYAEIDYLIDREQIFVNVVNTMIIMLLYIFLPFYMEGSTLGKKITKIKVVKEDGTKASLNTLFFRSMLINYLGYLLIALASIFILNSFGYFIVTLILTILEILLVIISSFMILYRHDKRGLHDIITHTKVVNI